MCFQCKFLVILLHKCFLKNLIHGMCATCLIRSMIFKLRINSNSNSKQKSPILSYQNTQTFNTNVVNGIHRRHTTAPTYHTLANWAKYVCSFVLKLRRIYSKLATIVNLFSFVQIVNRKAYRKHPSVICIRSK